MSISRYLMIIPNIENVDFFDFSFPLNYFVEWDDSLPNAIEMQFRDALESCKECVLKMPCSICSGNL